MEKHSAMIIDTIRVGKSQPGGYLPVTLLSDKGEVNTRYYHAPQEKRAVLFLSGFGTPFNSPAQDLYPKLCNTLLLRGISSLWIQFRHPTNLTESVLDVVGGIKFLQSFGIEEVAIVGHSFGGVVAIQAAANSPLVRTIITLATQSSGGDIISYLPQTSILFLHGTKDTVLSPSNSEYLHDIAMGTKGIILYEGASHYLNEVADKVFNDIEHWLLDKMHSQIEVV